MKPVVSEGPFSDLSLHKSRTNIYICSRVREQAQVYPGKNLFLGVAREVSDPRENISG